MAVTVASRRESPHLYFKMPRSHLSCSLVATGRDELVPPSPEQRRCHPEGSARLSEGTTGRHSSWQRRFQVPRRAAVAVGPPWSDTTMALSLYLEGAFIDQGNLTRHTADPWPTATVRATRPGAQPRRPGPKLSGAAGTVLDCHWHCPRRAGVHTDGHGAPAGPPGLSHGGRRPTGTGSVRDSESSSGPPRAPTPAGADSDSESGLALLSDSDQPEGSLSKFHCQCTAARSVQCSLPVDRGMLSSDSALWCPLSDSMSHYDRAGCRAAHVIRVIAARMEPVWSLSPCAPEWCLPAAKPP